MNTMNTKSTNEDAQPIILDERRHFTRGKVHEYIKQLEHHINLLHKHPTYAVDVLMEQKYGQQRIRRTIHSEEEQAGTDT